MPSVAGAMLAVSVMLALCAGVAESVTRKVTALVTAAVGVPLIAPLAALSVSPAGNVPLVTDQE